MKRLNLHGLLKLSALVVFLRIGGAVLALVFQVYLARWLGAEEFGIYVLMVAVASIGSIICGSGFPSVTPRFLPGYLAENRPDLAAAFVRSSRIHLALMSAGAFLTALLIYALPASLLSPHYMAVLVAGLVAAPFVGLMRLNGAIAISLRFPLLSYLPDLLLKPALLLTSAAALIWFSANANALAVLVVFVAIVASLSVGQSLILWSRRCIGAADTSTPAPVSMWRRAAIPMTVVVCLTSFVGDLDLLLLAFLLPTQDIAVFSIALRISVFLGFGIQVVFQLLTPDFSNAYTRGKLGEIRESLRWANAITISFAGAATVFVVLAGEQILGLFGSEFGRGHWSLILLCTVQLMAALGGPNAQLLNVAGQQKKLVMIFGTGLILLAALNLLLVPFMGLDGAALAFLIAAAYWHLRLSLAVFRQFGFHGSVLGLFRNPKTSEAAPATG